MKMIRFRNVDFASVPDKELVKLGIDVKNDLRKGWLCIPLLLDDMVLESVFTDEGLEEDYFKLSFGDYSFVVKGDIEGFLYAIDVFSRSNSLLFDLENVDL